MNLFLRDEHNPLFIAGTLKTIKDQKTTCTLWQNLNGKRLITKGLIFDLNFGAQVLSFNPISENFLFSPESEIFFQCEYKQLLFKAKVSFSNKTVLMLKIPKTAKAAESRSEQRFSLFSEKSSIDLVFLKSKAYDASPTEHVYRACDISNGGGSFLITTGSLTKFHIEDNILLKKIGQDNFNPTIEAQIRNIVPFQNPKFPNFGHHRVGFQFKTRFDVSGLSSIKQAMN